MIQNKNIENPWQKLILLSDNMFDYIARLLVWAVEGVAKVSQHPVSRHPGSLHCAYLKFQNTGSDVIQAVELWAETQYYCLPAAISTF